MKFSTHAGCWRMLLLCIVLIFTGCNKLVQVGTPASQLSTTVVFSSDDNALSALMGMYSRAMASQGLILNGGSTIYPAMSADECIPITVSTTLMDFRNNTLKSSNTYVSGIYASAYNTIYDANTLLENLPQSNKVTDTLRRQMEGEAHFMRAFLYFKLTDLFGPVPLETTTNADKNATMARTSTDTVYMQILHDLWAADSLLSIQYAYKGAMSQRMRTRPNKWTADALLAKIYLYQGNWVAAENAAGVVINSGAYQLDLLDSVFRADSQEAIWQLQPVSVVSNSAEGFTYLPVDNPQVRPPYFLDSFLLKAFEPGDQRRLHWLGSRTVGGVDYYYPAKYKVRLGGPPYQEYELVFRLAEVYLIRAEAEAELGALTAAIADLNIIRSRAGLGPLDPGLGKDEVLAAVMQERRIELFTEWGNRWSDLRRTGQADILLPVEKMISWISWNDLYPIPLRETQLNGAITQNQGY